MAIYAIGDIQGCYDPLRRLLDTVRFDPASDELWCLGDLINRGPRSLDTLRFLRDLDHAVTVVLGNHDLHFLALYHGCVENAGRHTLDALLSAPDGEELSDWLRHRPLAHYRSVATGDRERGYLAVHAGVAPQWTLDKTLQLAGEVESVLRGPDFLAFFRHMYGNEPRHWDEDLRGYDRLRTITNYLTRLRFCRPDGELEFRVKGGAGDAPPGFGPWFRFEQLTPATDILFGHWAALEGRTGHPHVHALDTGCVWGRELTMMRLQDQRLFSV